MRGWSRMSPGCHCSELNKPGREYKGSHDATVLVRTRIFSYRFIYLSAWAWVPGTVWEGPGGVALMKEVCSWGQALRFYAISGVCLSFCFVKVIDQDVIRTCLTVHMSPLHQDPVKKKFLFCFAFFVVCLDLVFYFDLFCWVLFLCFVIFSRCYLFRKAKEINFKKLKYSV